ncbi:oxidoreductase [Reticulibacter mediterranei]|uniref:Oxidoreductase n=1 Tax=Reticulibacter mediterranei TaxID=2778369 RepID=A0A8J3IS31_9CHLR|nr:SDR family NAD(P)-dependent oxidoreductase [Reticulibacter mediterranei]GHO97588.1 oxidoreductase [Reticulibacter mediterranei]
MKLTSNTVFITGGGTGIGLGLAQAFLTEGNTVIISGRRKDVLDKAVSENEGLIAVELDVTNQDQVATVTEQLFRDYPNLNVLMNNAGFAASEDLLKADYINTSAQIMNTNYLGTLRVTAAFTPHLLKQKDSTIITMSSGTGYVPAASVPTYSASKAAIHSFSESLRWQLHATNVQVIEIAPPAVSDTEFLESSVRGFGMNLDAFINETMHILKTNPDAKQVYVHDVHIWRFAERDGKYDEAFQLMNEH